MFEQLKNLTDDKVTMFWDFIFGFSDYNTSKVQLKDSNQDTSGPSLITFLIYLDEYRIKPNHMSFEYLDLKQFLSLGDNSYQNNLPTLCVLLRNKAKLFQEGVRYAEKDTQEIFDQKQSSLLTELVNLDVSFFQYIQTAYVLICQSIFDFFKEYIRQRAEMRAATHTFSQRNLGYFATFGKDEESNTRLLETALIFQKDDEKLISELWQNQVEKLNYFNLQGYDCTHLFKKMLHDLKKQILMQELPLHIVIDIEKFPLLCFFWNLSVNNPWQYDLRVRDFTPKAGFIENPYFELLEYYEPQLGIDLDDDYDVDENT